MRACLVGIGLALAFVPAAGAKARVQHGHKAQHAHKTHHAHRSHAAKGAVSASAGTSTAASTAACSQSPMTQRFLAFDDFNYYAAAPGFSGTGFDGSRWLLSGGAKILTTQLANGKTGQVLDLPAGATAISPDLCVMSGQNPEARAMVQSLNGGGGLQVQISYDSAGTWTNPQGAGSLNGHGNGWSASDTINIPPAPPLPPPAPPGPPTGWQIARFAFTAPNGHTDFQFYGLGIAGPPPTPSTGACSKPVLSQAFLPAGDTNYYTPAPGQSGGGFVGTGWTLTNGAKIETATRNNGSQGPVLDLPAGSMAVSPNICVTSLYPTARMIVRSVFGGDDISFRVSYWNTNTWTNPHETGHVQGQNTSWTLSNPVQLQPSNAPGWQIVRLTLVPDGGHSEFQIYDLELDPYARG